MKKLLIVGSALVFSPFTTSALAAETLTTDTSTQVQPAAEVFSTFEIIPKDEQEQAQVTSVSQLSDVQPTDWAFQALQSLVERYGCIAGYPSGVFRGNRAATRYELAAALNACLDQVSDRFATKEDLATVKALQEEFKAELATLKGRVDGLESRTATLESQQFSTTTKLVGEAIFQGSMSNNTTPAFLLADGTPFGLSPTGDNFTFNQRVTLSLLTSFNGKDLLVTSLQEGNFPAGGFASLADTTAATSQGGLAPSLNQVPGGNFGLYYLGYRFPVLKDKGTVFITATGGELSDFTDTLNPYFDSDGQGALSGFGIRNPIYRAISGRFASNLSSGNNVPARANINTSGTGVGFNYNFNDKLSLSLGYLATTDSAAQSTGTGTNITGSGLFGGDYAALAQLTFKPTKDFGVGLTYVRSYAVDPPFVSFAGGTGTFRANSPFFIFAPTSAHSAGLQFSWKASSRIALSGWAGATFATAEGDNNLNNDIGFIISQKGDTATILNYGLAVAFPDLFMPGNMGGLIIGSEPSVISSSSSLLGPDRDTNIHLEALYRFKVNDNITITPGVIAIINPEGNSSNDPIVMGTIRTTFTF